ncbi:hypothetical protein [Sphingomonas bacterium]|uniref:hypothetical protein n=1 Tax=Sphingomonas bacterium TaxID=1895847 RepID=UPI00157712CD|nr:hypothetical protein [Sphingomonas bacterium]
MQAVAAGIRIVAALMVLMGLLWIGQGTGLIHWPASSFMLDQRPWAVRGALLAIAGVGLWLAGRRVARR